MMACLARAYLSLGQADQALGWAEKAIHTQPDNPDLHYRHGICLANLDRVDDAKQAFAQCERLKPGFLELRKEWKPYHDDARNQQFFSGTERHQLL